MNPIVIPKNEASDLNPSQLKEYIKNHPSVLNHSSSLSTSSKKNEKNEDEKKDSIFIYFKQEEKIENEKNEKNKKNETDENFNDDESESGDEYVSKKDIDIQKLEDTVRYLKLDLNNEQLKVEELNELLKKETNLRQHYAKLNKYTKEYINFMQYKPFTSDYFSNYATYNLELIQVTKLYNEMEASFRKLLRWKQELSAMETEMVMKMNDNKDEKVEKVVLNNTDILDYFDREVRSKFDELSKSYQNTNQRLMSFAQKMVTMKYIIILLFLSNLFFMFRQ